MSLSAQKMSSVYSHTKSRDEEFVDESSHKNLAMLFQREAVTTKKMFLLLGFSCWMEGPLLWVNVHTRPKTGLSGVEEDANTTTQHN